MNFCCSYMLNAGLGRCRRLNTCLANFDLVEYFRFRFRFGFVSQVQVLLGATLEYRNARRRNISPEAKLIASKLLQSLLDIWFYLRYLRGLI